MNYLVLARKYRPHTFPEMVGQDHVVQALTNALDAQRLHHAYLFTGTRGVGKTTISRILAKSLNCEKGIASNPCGVCAACQAIDVDRFADYTELDAASNRGVDEVQSLLEQSAYKPAQGRFKVFMIDEVHMLTTHAFNAMLKTLEEPPEYMKFVLATTDPQKVPVTVLSRCLQFNLRPMLPNLIAEYLSKILTRENISFDTQALNLIAKNGRGSMRDALSLTDQAIAYSGGKVEVDMVRKMLGAVDNTYIVQLIQTLATGNGKAMLSIVDGLRLQGLNAAATLEEMAEILSRVAVYQTLGHQDVSALGEDASYLPMLGDALKPDELQLLYSICLKGRAELDLATDEYCALSMVLLRFLVFAKPSEAAPSPSRQDGLGNGSNLTNSQHDQQPRAQNLAPTQQVMAAPSAPPLCQAPSSNEQSNPLSDLANVSMPPKEPEICGATDTPKSTVINVAPAAADELSDFWFDVIQQLIQQNTITAMTKELALQAQLIAKENDIWHLRLESDNLNRPAFKTKLREAFTSLGYDVDLKVEVGPVGVTPSKRLSLTANQRQKAAEALIYADPLVQHLVREFDAKVINGSIKPVI